MQQPWLSSCVRNAHLFPPWQKEAHTLVPGDDTCEDPYPKGKLPPADPCHLKPFLCGFHRLGHTVYQALRAGPSATQSENPGAMI